jgi:hypothetical protein
LARMSRIGRCVVCASFSLRSLPQRSQGDPHEPGRERRERLVQRLPACRQRVIAVPPSSLAGCGVTERS